MVDSKKILCKIPFQQAFIYPTNKGFKTHHCCIAKSKEQYVDNLGEFKNSDYLKKVRTEFFGNTLPESCQQCILIEQAGEKSKRQKSFEDPLYDNEIIVKDDGELINDFVDFDLRADNTCNLKCIMCSPLQSSLWHEDIDIFNKHIVKVTEGIHTRKNAMDWNYIKENTFNKAKKINIVGGEPFYMKDVINYLEELSQYSFNRDNTLIALTTNGVSFNDKLEKTLSLFKNINITVSIDGLEQVNEYIRFPTNWSTFKIILERLKEVATQLDFNLTLSALNLPDILNVEKFTNGHKLNIHRLYHPDIIRINSLKPHIIENVRRDHIGRDSQVSRKVLSYLEDYQYDATANQRLINYLHDLDSKRSLSGPKQIPWVFA
jgi:sulfatase maturation enzyme AslB (radical SAM superfamily)